MAVVLACSASDDSASSGAAPAPCVGPSCEAAGDAAEGDIMVDVGAPDVEPSREVSVNPLCGLGCDPDDRWALDCLDTESDEALDAGAGGSTGDATPPPTLDELPESGCQVRQVQGAPVAECRPAGTRLDGEQCSDSADCAPGFACVRKEPTDDLEPARCRRFCCHGIDSCEEGGTYCAERILVDAADPEDADPLSVPVCVLGDNCSLAEPYPCDDTQFDCRCPESTACTVVRADGTTACLPPGEGVAGEPCPCAAGYVCSESTQTCLRLCQTNSTNAQCDLGRCQASAALPEPFGVCTMEGLAE